MENEYNLSYDAQEIDELLGKVKNGVCLPYVELESIADTSGAPVKCTDTENAILEAVAAKKLPIVIHAGIGQNGTEAYRCTAVFTYMEAPDGVGFKTTLMGIEMSVGTVFGEWTIVVKKT